jgi:VCBS repeat-containing protein
LPPASTPSRWRWGEFNQDGDPDLAVAEESGRVLVLLGGPGGGFTGSTAVVSGSQALGGLSSVAVGDFNRDGDLDLVVAHRSGNQVRVLLGGPGGGFGSPNNVPTGTLPASVAVADFNADGKPDLVTTHPTTNTVAVLLNTTVTNRAPVATDDAYTTAEDITLTVAPPGVLGNDSDRDGDALTAVRVSGPAHGTLTLNANGSLTYTPDADYNGTDSFTYQANDGSLDSTAATVTLTVTAVNDAPKAGDDAYSTKEDTTLNVAAPGVLVNDSDPDGNPLTARRFSGPSHGTLTLNPSGSFSYVPDADFAGTDSFTYQANDGSLDSTAATVSLTVTAVNDAELITKTQAMNGDLKVPPGSQMRVGYDFTIPGAHPAATIGFVGARVTFNVTCTVGTPSSSTLVVPIEDRSYLDPQNGSGWYPSGDQTDASTYQGSAPVPTCSDPSGLIRLQQGGTFAARVTSDVNVAKVNIRWHYKGVTGSGGGWSGTYSVILS